MLLKLVSAVSFDFFNGAPGKIKIAYVACVIFLLTVADLESCNAEAYELNLRTRIPFP